MLRCNTAALWLAVLVALPSAEEPFEEAGAELYLDGAENFFAAFPDFSLLSDWTIEAWVLPRPNGLPDPQCFLHLSTYSLANLLTLELRPNAWRLQYGEWDLDGPCNATDTSNVSLTSDPHHVAITHRLAGTSQAELTFYLDGTCLAFASMPQPDVQLPPLPFIFGACSLHVRTGFARHRHFRGHLDELRRWSVVRTQEEILAAMNRSGPVSLWPELPVGLVVQHSFDIIAGEEVRDTSGRGVHGVLGGGGSPSELPHYRRSSFGSNLSHGALYFEAWASGNVSCPSTNCLNLTHLLSNDTGHNAFLLVTVPSKSYLTTAGNSTPLVVGMLVAEPLLLVHVRQSGADAFELQLCLGAPGAVPVLSGCWAQPVHAFTLRLLEPRAPTAGEAFGLQLSGRDGFVELREPLPESGTVEFWAQMQHLDGDQMLFSVAHSETGEDMLSLGLSNGEFSFHLCSAVSESGGVKPVTVQLPELSNTEPQHIAISWAYLRSARGRAMYEVAVYRNCARLTRHPLVVKDACAHFGEDDAVLRLPTLGQRYSNGGSTAFASLHLDDLRVWHRAVAPAELCARQHAFLVGTEEGLQAYIPVTAEDARRGGTILEDRARGVPADLRCTSTRLACPRFEHGRGYRLRPSVFALAPEPRMVETFIGAAPLEVQLPSFDVDNDPPHDLPPSVLDNLRVQLVELTDPTCGSLRVSGTGLAANQGDSFTELDLPLLFAPNASDACQTSFTYVAIDSHGLESPFKAEIQIAVKPPGPQVVAVDIFDQGISDDQNDPGDAIAVRFDKPTTRAADWHGLFEVVNGSLGSAKWTANWSEAGDVLIIELLEVAGDIDLVPGTTRLRFPGGTAIRLAGGDSYPSTGLSPALQGSFGVSACTNGNVFSRAQARCHRCDEGDVPSADGLRCEPCAPGTYVPGNSAGCLPCPKGMYLPVGAPSRVACVPADPGHYVPREALVVQFACPAGMLAEDSKSSTCGSCPYGADCETQAHFRSLAAPRPGYFRTSRREILKCKVAAACLGWNPSEGQNACSEGMGEHLCQACLEGYWRPNDQPYELCRPCGQTWGLTALNLVLTVLVVTSVMWLLGVLSVDAACWGNMHIVVIRILLNYFTAASVFSRLQPWELEPALGPGAADAFITALSWMTRFNGGVPAHLMGLECWSGRNTWQVIKTQTWLWVLLPVIWPLGVALLGLAFFELYTLKVKVHRMLRKDAFKKDSYHRAASNTNLQFAHEPRLLGLWRTRAARCRFRDRWQMGLADSMPVVVVGYFLLLPAALRILAVPLTCHSIGEAGSEVRLLAVAEVRCWHGEHVAWSVAAVFGFVLWGLAVPLFSAVSLWRRRELIHEDAHEKISLVWFSEGYEHRFIYWESLVQLRRVLIILVSAWPDLTRQAEMALYQVVGVAALLVHFSLKPFDNRLGELLDRQELLGLCCFLLGVTVLQLVLLADSTRPDILVGVFWAGAALTLILLVASASRLELYMRGASVLCVVALLVQAVAGEAQLASATLLFYVVAVNGLYVLWLLQHLLLLLWEAAAETVKRRAVKEKDSWKPKEAWQIGEDTRHILGAALPPGALMPRPKLPQVSGSGSWRERLAAFVVRTHGEVKGALIRFDVDTEELVLGLHMNVILNDADMSSYTRSKLAKLGPFLSDAERNSVSISIRDALMHVIVHCGSTMIPCSLLEFLVRVAFVWCYKENTLLDTGSTSATPVWLSTASVTLTDIDSSDEPMQDVLEQDFVDQLFDRRIFEKGVTASEFTEQLERITRAHKDEVLLMLQGFLEARARHVG